jgi:hypothetical protein
LYNRGLVTSVTGVDLSQGMLDQATRRIESAGISHWANLQTGALWQICCLQRSSLRMLRHVTRSIATVKVCVPLNMLLPALSFQPCITIHK